ncbi:MAG: hypothetical protein HXX15_11120 [Rhodopseudomonas sp.]|uniref:hypothetical protein n=1 Tax=Rhodopseudomonas sp. TaxID=1078 RepID=UPI00182054DD|nr:hypothetical protein [Rhodopseudomonas sp.]NVN86626.1 hypothetical protein [Rhodopseudomonas sp.]
MTNEGYSHQFSSWAKERIDEIEATLASIETRAATLQDEAKRQAEQAIAQINVQRDAFLEAVRKQQHEGEAAWTAAKADLAPAWASFEATVQGYMSDVVQQAEQQTATFKARADAQREAWQQASEALLGKTVAFAEAKKKDVEAAMVQLKTEAEAARLRLEAQQKAGADSWSVMKSALEESRSAFDSAIQKALDAFKKAS